MSEFTYTLESIIQAGKKKMAIAHLPISSQKTRPSRLFSSTWEYVKRSAATILRIYAMYEPFKVFTLLGGVLIAAATAIGLRFLYYYLVHGGAGHIQSLILAAAFLIIGFLTMLIGMLADLIGRNRQLSEDVLLRVRRLELALRASRIGDSRPSDAREAERLLLRRRADGSQR